MKTKQLYLLFLLIASQIGYSQIIVDVASKHLPKKAGHYYKDIFESYEPFIGTWVFNQDGKILKIVLKKQFYYSSVLDCSTDFLVGEYQYIDSGLELVNTLPLLSNNTISPYDRNIHGSSFRRIYTSPQCLDCDVNIRKVGIFLTDPNIPYLSGATDMNFICIKADDHNKMIMNFYSTSMDLPTDDSPNSFTVPEKQYILTKQ